MLFTEDEQEASWIFAQFGRSRADNVQWLSPFFGKQLACDCGQSKCHAAVLDELICELVTSGAMTNEGCEFSAAPSGRNSIPDGSGAPSWYASSSSAWPESWTVLCTEMRSFQCRCFWNLLPDKSVLSQSIKQAFVTIHQTGRLGCSLVAGYHSQPRVQLAKPFILRGCCGLTSGRESCGFNFASLRCLNPGQACAIATTSEGLLDLDTIAVHSNLCLGSG